MSAIHIILCWSWLCWFFFVMPGYAQVDFKSDTILPGQQMNDGVFLSSSNKIFKLQFFSPAASPEQRYLAIFRSDYLEQPVWIANRNRPINDTSGVLMLNSSSSILHIKYNGGNIIFPTTSSTGYTNINTSATLQDDGNLVFRQVSASRTILWQSFDFPTDVLLPGMKLGIDLKTGQQWSLTSWISDRSPSSGSFNLSVDRNSANQLVIWWHGNVFWASNAFADFKPVSNDNEKYFIYSKTRDGKFRAIRLRMDGKVVEIPVGHELVSCDLSSSTPDQQGCVPNQMPACAKSDNSFYESKGNYSSSASSIQENNKNLSLVDCEAKCMKDCSCYAYDSLNEDGSGCEYWDRNYVNFGQHFGSVERTIYIRRTTAAKVAKRWRVWLIASVGGTFLMILNIIFILRKQRIKARRKEAERLRLQDLVNSNIPLGEYTTMVHEMATDKNEMKIGQVDLFSFETIEIATNRFSPQNKLGEGGFGPVYKGTLLDGQNIAVKRLSRRSTQGLVEFENEIQLIVKLQHNNLVRLLGCCIHREEMMLIYEYMHNKSLDFFLFDPTNGKLLKWTDRMNIIEGIAQGLLYLHKHSRLKVIHRDVKASNILLDENMNPKISDFGMARMFGGQDSESSTKRIVGTYGYMSPEYAIKGIVTTKIDVFSYGVLILEIVSGKRNHTSYDSERTLNLIGMAWESWVEGKALDLVDTAIDVSNHVNEVERCIRVGLWCVQDNAADRPSMADVIYMLKNESLKLPAPKQPGFFVACSSSVDTEREIVEEGESYCSNNFSISIVEAR